MPPQKQMRKAGFNNRSDEIMKTFGAQPKPPAAANAQPKRCPDATNLI
jgi:hypothetical protein